MRHQPDAAWWDISIHALREEGDHKSDDAATRIEAISIHALREEGDGLTVDERNWMLAFLSTPSARRATGAESGHAGSTEISIHALREEGDDGR